MKNVVVMVSFNERQMVLLKKLDALYGNDASEKVHAIVQNWLIGLTDDELS